MANSVVSDIAVLNESSVVNDSDLQVWVKAIQRQLDEQVEPFWGVTANLHFLPKGSERPSGQWWMVVTDTTDLASALGYHDLTSDGQPLGKVFAKTVNDEGWGAQESPSRVLSHEVIEIIVDPLMVRVVDLPDAEYLVEPGDPVFLPTQGYAIDNVLVSDWATPAYYHYNTDTRYDHQGFLNAPCPAMIHGTYLMFRQGQGGAWQTKQMLQGVPGPALDRLRYMMRPRNGSRRYRRMIGRQNWVHSTKEPPRELGDLIQGSAPASTRAVSAPLAAAGTDRFPSGSWGLGPINIQWSLKSGNEVDVDVSVIGVKIDTLTGTLSAQNTRLQDDLNILGIVQGALALEARYGLADDSGLYVEGQLQGPGFNTGQLRSKILSW
jgi:hypothetical protein